MEGDDVEEKQTQFIVFQNIYSFKKLQHLVRAIVYHEFCSTSIVSFGSFISLSEQ